MSKPSFLLQSIIRVCRPENGKLRSSEVRKAAENFLLSSKRLSGHDLAFGLNQFARASKESSLPLRWWLEMAEVSAQKVEEVEPEDLGLLFNALSTEPQALRDLLGRSRGEEGEKGVGRIPEETLRRMNNMGLANLINAIVKSKSSGASNFDAEKKYVRDRLSPLIIERAGGFDLHQVSNILNAYARLGLFARPVFMALDHRLTAIFGSANRKNRGKGKGQPEVSSRGVTCCLNAFGKAGIFPQASIEGALEWTLQDAESLLKGGLKDRGGWSAQCVSNLMHALGQFASGLEGDRGRTLQKIRESTVLLSPLVIARVMQNPEATLQNLCNTLGGLVSIGGGGGDSAVDLIFADQVRNVFQAGNEALLLKTKARTMQWKPLDVAYALRAVCWSPEVLDADLKIFLVTQLAKNVADLKMRELCMVCNSIASLSDVQVGKVEILTPPDIFLVSSILKFLLGRGGAPLESVSVSDMCVLVNAATKLAVDRDLMLAFLEKSSASLGARLDKLTPSSWSLYLSGLSRVGLRPAEGVEEAWKSQDLERWSLKHLAVGGCAAAKLDMDLSHLMKHINRVSPTTICSWPLRQTVQLAFAFTVRGDVESSSIACRLVQRGLQGVNSTGLINTQDERQIWTTLAGSRERVLSSTSLRTLRNLDSVLVSMEDLSGEVRCEEGKLGLQSSVGNTLRALGWKVRNEVSTGPFSIDYTLFRD